MATGDPRLSLEERYRDHDGFVKFLTAEAGRLVKRRFLLQEDADRYVQGARDSKVLRATD